MNPNADILVIDDDPYVHDAVKMILEPEGYKLRTSLTGPAGLDAMRRQPPDLLLLDIMLASPSEGFHLVYQMKKDPRLEHIPVIVISAVGQSMGFDFAREVGTDFLPVRRFLEKPINAAVLRQAVREILTPAEAHP
ncbi:Transcriptional regulatory protein AfsQ1 [Phycisphaerae bacterium RAS1]|nr:Transcriptional regulatory protein AfsQ1 [Phycisphaerae bacterium RAS1]